MNVNLDAFILHVGSPWGARFVCFTILEAVFIWHFISCVLARLFHGEKTANRCIWRVSSSLIPVRYSSCPLSEAKYDNKHFQSVLLSLGERSGIWERRCSWGMWWQSFIWTAYQKATFEWPQQIPICLLQLCGSRTNETWQSLWWCTQGEASEINPPDQASPLSQTRVHRRTAAPMTHVRDDLLDSLVLGCTTWMTWALWDGTRHTSDKWLVSNKSVATRIIISLSTKC